MPSNKEIEELQKQYPNMRMWGVDFNSFRENPRLGDIIVVPFYDVIDALAACEQRIRLEMYESEREHLHQMRCLTLDAARETIAAAYDDERYAHSDDWGVPVVYKDLMLAAIDTLREEAR